MTFSHDEAAALVGNPATEAAALAEIAQLYPDLRPAVLGHANVYPGLSEWIAQVTPPATVAAAAQPGSGSWLAAQLRQHRARSIAILAAAVLVVGGAGAAAAVTIANGANSRTTAAPSSPENTSTKAPVPTATPTPQAPSELYLGADQMGMPLGGTVVVGESYTVGPSIDAPATLYFPGRGSVLFDATVVLPGEDVVYQELTVTGPDLQSVVMLVKIREPAKGLDPERYHFDLIMVGESGAVVNRTVVADDVDSGTSSWVLVGSASDVVAVQVYAGAQTTWGINARTGAQVWSSTEPISEMTFGTLLQEARSTEMDRLDSPCLVVSALDIETGDALWTVDGTATRTAKGYCTSLRVEYGPQFEFGQPNGVVVIEFLDDGPYVAITSLVGFNATTGAKLSVSPVGVFDEVDPTTGHVVTFTEEGSLVVYDSRTGSTVYSVEAQRVTELNLRITGFYGGLLHTTTTDGAPVVDVASGEVVADGVGFEPIGAVGDWTLYSDGVLSKDRARIS